MTTDKAVDAAFWQAERRRYEAAHDRAEADYRAETGQDFWRFREAALNER